MAQTRISEEGVHWRIKSPNGDGLVWLIWEGKGRRLALNLGAKHQARNALANWLAATENKEADGARAEDLMWMPNQAQHLHAEW